MRNRLLPAILVGLVVLAPGCRRRGRTVQDWATVPVTASLRPVEPYAQTKTLLLRVRNTSQRRVRVDRIAMLQVGRTSTHRTTAYQPLAEAANVKWSLAPGQERTFTFDLRRISFLDEEDDRRRPADVFVDEIPESDREFSVSVLHRSHMWSAGYQSIIHYRPH
ncbi:MAG TPA: hypothetical protein VM733_13570 [Thermoanaerobaculia bacterium]|nr:hypothetical protein [Thermoanaerobaculia bacterium]